MLSATYENERGKKGGDNYYYNKTKETPNEIIWKITKKYEATIVDLGFIFFLFLVIYFDSYVFGFKMILDKKKEWLVKWMIHLQ